MSKKKELLIIIVTYNSAHFIRNCILAIKSNGFSLPYEIIVIDNYSQDTTVEIIKKCFSDIRLIENMKNVGFAKAVNQGLSLAKGKYVFLINPDTEISSTTLTKFYNFMENEKNKNVWCVGGALFDEKLNPQISFGRFPKVFDVFFEQFGFHKIFKKYNDKKLKLGLVFNKEIKQVDYLNGADLFMRAKVIRKIGCFDEDFFLNYEETELFLRAKRFGYISIILPTVKIKHYGQKSFISKENYIYHLKLGELLFFKKYSFSRYLMAKSFLVVGSFFRLFYPGGTWKRKLLKDIISI